MSTATTPNITAYTCERAADDELQRLAHRGDVGSDVDRVGDEQQRDHEATAAAAESGAHVGGEAVPVTRPMRALTIWMPTISG